MKFRRLLFIFAFLSCAFSIKAQSNADAPNEEVPLQLQTIMQLVGSPADSVAVFLDSYGFTVISAKPPRTLYALPLDKQVQVMLKNDENMRLSIVSVKMPDSYIPSVYQLISALRLQATGEVESTGYSVFKSDDYLMKLNPAYQPGVLLFFFSKRAK